jgi:hypothetical protein
VDFELVQTQLIAGVIVAYVIEFLKKTDKFPWLSIHSTEVTRWLSRAVAIGIGVGISVTWGDHQVILGWPTSMDAAIEEFKNAFTSWIIQEASYKGLIKPAVPAVVEKQVIENHTFVARLPRTPDSEPVVGANGDVA